MPIAELEKNTYTEEVKFEFIPVLGANLSLYYLDYDSFAYDFDHEIPMTFSISSSGSWYNAPETDETDSFIFTNTNIWQPWKLGFKVENTSPSNVPNGRYFGIFKMNIYIKDQNGDFEEDPYYSRIFEYGGLRGGDPEDANKTIFVNATSVSTYINLSEFYSSSSSKEHVSDVHIYLTRTGDARDAEPVDVCVSPISGGTTAGMGTFEFKNDVDPTITIPFLLGIEGQGYSSSSFLVSDLGKIVTYVMINDVKGNPFNDDFSLYIKPGTSNLLQDGYFLPTGTYTATVYINAIVPD